MATAREVLDLPAPEVPSTAMTRFARTSGMVADTGGKTTGGSPSPVLRVSRDYSGLVVHAVADEGAGHAVPATATPAQLGADDGDHLDTGLAEKRVGQGI